MTPSPTAGPFSLFLRCKGRSHATLVRPVPGPSLRPSRRRAGHPVRRRRTSNPTRARCSATARPTAIRKRAGSSCTSRASPTSAASSTAGSWRRRSPRRSAASPQRQSPKAPADGWKATRTLVNALFLRRYDKEYLEEMKGIADGAAAAGASFDGRQIDLIDIVAINSWPEIDDARLGPRRRRRARRPALLEGLQPRRDAAQARALQRLRRRRPGHRRRQDRLRPHHHVSPLSAAASSTSGST